VRLIDEAERRSTKHHLILDFPSFDNRWIEACLNESIDKTTGKLIQHIRSAVDRHGSLESLCNWSQIVDPMYVIGMVMGDDYSIHSANAGGKKLLAEVRPAIDQQALAAAFHQDGGS
jgi:hypothetical protein